MFALIPMVMFMLWESFPGTAIQLTRLHSPGHADYIGRSRHHRRNAGFIRQQHAPAAQLPDESGVPRGHGIVHWWQCPDAQTTFRTTEFTLLVVCLHYYLVSGFFKNTANLWQN
jgi:hypothetical protein